MADGAVARVGDERRDSHTVHVRPELVVEVAFDGVQTSSRYPGGVALRFARVKGYRPDKRPEDADTIEAAAIHEGSSSTPYSRDVLTRTCFSDVGFVQRLA